MTLQSAETRKELDQHKTDARQWKAKADSLQKELDMLTNSM